MALTNKQKIFVTEYLKCFNATQAARLAGYKGDDATLATVGSENIRKLEIKEAIDLRLREAAMSADEVLMRLADLARNAEGENNRIKALELLSKRWGILQEKLELSGSLEQTLVILPQKDNEQ